MKVTAHYGRLLGAFLTLMLLSACTTSPPEQVDNVCDIFLEKSGWYEDAKGSRARWNVPVSVSMAFMHQESRFVATAKPPRKKLFGVIPGPRPSDAYGYSQAKNSTWDWYQRSSGQLRCGSGQFWRRNRFYWLVQRYVASAARA